MKYFIISDIHSFYDQMIQALEIEAGFDYHNPEHILVSCGDLLDRGPKTLECLRYVNGLPDNRKIFIRGNHEDLLIECLNRKEFYSHDLHNGTIKTIMALSGHEDNWFYYNDYYDCFKQVKNNQELKDYLKCLKDYSEIGDYIFVHGWIPDPEDGNWKEGDWKSARWVNGMSEWDRGNRIEGRTIVCGHWHTSWGHSNLHYFGTEWNDPSGLEPTACFLPFKDKGIIALDACTAYSGKVNCLVLEI